jgi:hypothetical protein
MARRCDFPVFDADNHLYETEDAFTRHLPDRYKGAIDIPANTELPVLTHTTTVPSGTTNLNDVATATYTDKVTGVPVPGTTQATCTSAS